MAARHDHTTDPRITESLLLARRGTAYFSRYLAQLTAEDMSDSSLIPGWDRAHVVAHVGYHARELAHLIEEVRTGTPVAESGAHDVDYGATLPDAALRNLHAHAAVHLNVEWRDLPAEKWNTVIPRDGQPPVHVADTAWRRAYEVWVHAVDLNVGARLEDFPPRLLERLLHDAMESWQERAEQEENHLQLVLRPTDRNTDDRLPHPGQGPKTDEGAMPGHIVILEGTLAALTRWALGRGAAGVHTTDGTVPILRPWAPHADAYPYPSTASLVMA